MQTQPRPQPAHPPRSHTSRLHAAIVRVKTPPPILASEVLREDLAPLEPGRSASRVWDVAFAGVYLAIGAALRFGLGLTNEEPRAGAVCLAAAAASCVTALVPFPYVWRACVGGLIGATLLLLGFGAVGPLALLAGQASPLWVEVCRVVAFCTIPATLLFRSHYRAYSRGRVLLGIALVTAVPFLLSAVLMLFGGTLVAKVGAGLAITGVLCALGALASTPTITVSAWAAQALVAIAALDVGLRDLYLPAPAQAGPFAYTLTSVTFFAAVVPMGLGLFQILASVYAPKARLAAASSATTPEEPPSLTGD